MEKVEGLHLAKPNNFCYVVLDKVYQLLLYRWLGELKLSSVHTPKRWKISAGMELKGSIHQVGHMQSLPVSLSLHLAFHQNKDRPKGILAHRREALSLTGSQ